METQTQTYSPFEWPVYTLPLEVGVTLTFTLVEETLDPLFAFAPEYRISINEVVYDSSNGLSWSSQEVDGKTLFIFEWQVPGGAFSEVGLQEGTFCAVSDSFPTFFESKIKLDIVDRIS